MKFKSSNMMVKEYQHQRFHPERSNVVILSEAKDLMVNDEILRRKKRSSG